MSHPARLNFMAYVPDLAKQLTAVSMSITKSGDLDLTTAYLVDIRASQLNGCAFCLDMHVKEAKLHDERELRLHHVAIWRESQLFTPKERAALLLTEALTRIAPDGISDEVYAEAREHFSEKELAVLVFRIMTINAWNRLNVAFRTAPGGMDKMLGLDKAGLV